MAQKTFNSKLLTNLARSLISGNPDADTAAVYKTLGRGNVSNLNYDGNNKLIDFSITNPKAVQSVLKPGISVGPEDPLTKEMFNDNFINTFARNKEDINRLYDTSNGVSIGQLGKLAIGAASEHPFKTAGLVGLGAGNVGGLMDNNKFGGQLGGLALGGLGSYLMGANPYTAAMVTMGGGALGALFDKLRAKREQQNQQPYYGGR